TVPTIVKMLVEHPAVDRHDHSSLRYVIYAGAPMYRADQQRALRTLGPVLVQYFDLGEVTGCITVLTPSMHSPDDDAPEANVYPREVEEVLLTHPSVAEVAVLGVPDEKWGEVGVAVVVVRDGHDCDAAALLAHLEGRCARYRWPRHVLFWSALPKSAYGKITK